MKEKMKNLCEVIKKKWKEKEWRKKIGNAMLIILAVCGVAFVAIRVCQLLYQNKDVIIYFVIGITIIVAWWRWLFPKKQPKIETQPVRQNVIKPIYLQQHLLNEFMFSLFQSLSVPLHIMKPNLMSDIMDKPDMYTDNATNVTYFRYNVIMNGEAIEEKLFKEILRKGIEKGLPTARLGNPIVEYNNKQYSKLRIEEVKFTGASWRVVVVIVDADYASVLENKAQRQQYIEQKEEVIFYEDGDFS